MTASNLNDLVKVWAESFGVKLNAGDKNNSILRKNIEYIGGNDAQYFGYIRPEEQASGSYSDFSYVVFPQENNGECVLAIGVGSEGFRNDYDLAALPGLRRRFLHLLDINQGGCKTYFLDIEKPVTYSFIELVNNNAPALNGAVDKYKNVLSVYQLVDPDTETGKKTLKAWLALYAEIRGWATTIPQKQNIINAIRQGIINPNYDSDLNKIRMLVKDRRFVVLQGAPGTGKTRLAKQIASEDNSEIIFTQFHAETTYSNFIYGIRPKLEKDVVQYEEVKGDLYRAIEFAEILKERRSDKKVYLIIDEINRANLATVLGPIFYLFEYQMSESLIKIDLGGGKMISQIPDNLYVIATMNTADRSLAVVDFALRRRFAWYTLKPSSIPDEDLPNGLRFFREQFDKINSLFELYASDEELNLQPGQGYFIAADEQSMKNRMIYELMSLIKEYFTEGLLLRARDEFVNYFYNETGELLYK